jgi:hypothetical protein
MKTPEDEEFERIEREQKRINEKQEKLRNEMYLYTVVQITRNQAIEEVAQEIEKFKAFGADTIASFTVYIRSMKK